MSKLPVVSGLTCVRALEHAGFYVSRQKGSHTMLHRDDPPARVTVPNHKTLHTGTLRSILRSASLSVDEFIDLLDR
jgi:predicted RNA binding protein YcfA (HicA-like mRNA interferase family)